jgi:hypothetical protein
MIENTGSPASAGTRRTLTAGLLAAMLFATVSGCTYSVRPSPNPRYSPVHKQKLNAGLYVSPAGRLSYFDYAAGLFTKYRIEYGDALVRGADLVFGGMFEKTTWLDSLPEATAEHVDLIVKLEMAGFEVSSGLAASCNIACTVTAPDGRELYHKHTFGAGKGEMIGVMLIGSLAYEPALRQTSEEAITKALLFQVSQMEKEIDFAALR